MRTIPNTGLRQLIFFGMDKTRNVDLKEKLAQFQLFKSNIPISRRKTNSINFNKAAQLLAYPLSTLLWGSNAVPTCTFVEKMIQKLTSYENNFN